MVALGCDRAGEIHKMRTLIVGVLGLALGSCAVLAHSSAAAQESRPDTSQWTIHRSAQFAPVCQPANNKLEDLPFARRQSRDEEKGRGGLG